MEREPQFYFTEYFRNDPENLDGYFEDAYSLIVVKADRKGIEFDGYFKERWEQSANSIIHFNQEYFDDLRGKSFMYISYLFMMKKYIRIYVMPIT